MKKQVIITLLSITFNIQAQNVGINNTSPKTALDVKGGIRNQAYYMIGSGTSIVIPDNQSNINLAGTFSGQFAATVNTPEDGQKLTIDNLSNETGVLSSTVDIRKGLNEYTFSDGEWKAVNTNAWGLNGNANTDPNTNFIGTIDKNDVVLKRYNEEKMRLTNNEVQITGHANVNGNINVTGTIQANGVAGTQNQVLITNSAGNLAWSSLCDYKNFIQFAANGTWTVPPNVTSILVEIWGGGGGGNGNGITDATTAFPGPGSGGGGGAYGKTVLNVSPGGIITITVGAGGTGNTGGATPAPATNGQSSTVASTSQFFSVGGGFAATNTSSGIGGLGFGATAGLTFQFFEGKDGEYVKSVFSQSSATDFWQENFYGKGGDAGNSPNSGGAGGSYKRNISTLASGVSKPALGGQSYGGGGGGGHGPAANGAKGTVIIYW